MVPWMEDGDGQDDQLLAELAEWTGWTGSCIARGSGASSSSSRRGAEARKKDLTPEQAGMCSLSRCTTAHQHAQHEGGHGTAHEGGYTPPRGAYSLPLTAVLEPFRAFSDFTLLDIFDNVLLTNILCAP